MAKSYLIFFLVLAVGCANTALDHEYYKTANAGNLSEGQRHLTGFQLKENAVQDQKIKDQLAKVHSSTLLNSVTFEKVSNICDNRYAKTAEDFFVTPLVLSMAGVKCIDVYIHTFEFSLKCKVTGGFEVKIPARFKQVRWFLNSWSGTTQSNEAGNVFVKIISERSAPYSLNEMQISFSNSPKLALAPSNTQDFEEAFCKNR